jgi:release factor glutamine methyltransferase
VLGSSRLTLYTEHDRPMSAAETAAYRAAIARRGSREPVAYITGRRGFRRLELAVDPSVLVPRPETEVLVDRVLEVAADGAAVLDWGTGSGAVALSLANERPDLRVTGADRSEAALAVARGNDRASTVEWVMSDGFAALVGRRFDIAVANPPYLADADLAAAAPELAFEPAGALASGPTGLEALSAIAGEAPGHLNPGGWLVVEVGVGQSDAVRRLFTESGFVDVDVRPDLAGISRVVAGRLG